MTSATASLLKRIHETKAVSIWDHSNGPVFWYAASVPGPFYVNTEQVLGPALADKLLKQITTIIETIAGVPERSAELYQLIRNAYDADPNFQAVITPLVDKIRSSFDLSKVDAISGGERRDWLFSLPVAWALDKPHLYLFKNKMAYCATPVGEGHHVLHISDLINNAASYFDLWLPILEAMHVTCIGTACINTRGENGLNRLETAGYKVAALNHIDLAFFQKSADSGLIRQEVVEEIATYLMSGRAWAARYLMQDVNLFGIQSLDKKSLDRLCTFFQQDPWNLRDDHAAFFGEVLSTVARLRGEAFKGADPAQDQRRA
ncbi:MAG: hypothetical protein JO126_08880 [Alphaproteobacteria bacterium]|nr:hypothetical protein [Alphaproteobacteria bacterium]MBV8549555.1 hypothetical protein [Alphaproteobacteria bacterium]